VSEDSGRVLVLAIQPSFVPLAVSERGQGRGCHYWFRGVVVLPAPPGGCRVSSRARWGAGTEAALLKTELPLLGTDVPLLRTKAPLLGTEAPGMGLDLSPRPPLRRGEGESEDD